MTILKAFTQVAKVTERVDRTEEDQHYGLASPVLRRLVGSMSKAKQDTEDFVQCLDDHAAMKDDKLQMFRTDTLAEKWPEVLEHRSVSFLSLEFSSTQDMIKWSSLSFQT